MAQTYSADWSERWCSGLSRCVPLAELSRATVYAYPNRFNTSLRKSGVPMPEIDEQTLPREPECEIVSITALPPIAMVWNASMATSLHPDQVRRWWVTGGECNGWSRRDVVEMIRLCCICHLGPSTETDMCAVVVDLHKWICRQSLRSDSETLIHELTLAFCKDRAKTRGWPLPNALAAKHTKAVANLMRLDDGLLGENEAAVLRSETP